MSEKHLESAIEEANHEARKKEPKRHKKIERGAIDFAVRFEGVMKDLAEEKECVCNQEDECYSCELRRRCSPPTQKESHPEAEEWSEKFDKEVKEDKSIGGELYRHKWIKSFIKSLLASKRQELLKEMLEKTESFHSNCDLRDFIKQSLEKIKGKE